MNNRRKNRGGPTNRAPRRIVAEGVYGNPHFMHAATSQVGSVVRIQAVSGNVWEGIFKTFSAQFDIVLEVAAKVENPESPHNSSLAADSLVDKLIFKPGDIISMVAKDVDVEYATRDTFQTDTAISARLNGQNMREEKELEPWEPTGVNGGDTSLEFEPGSNGWDANEMFRKNEQTYGVQSTYDHSLTGYTVQLQPTDTADYREAEAKANEIANEIENHPTYKARGDLENGDEEERFAAVSRPNQEYSKPTMESSSATAKYVPPAKRKGQTAGKLMRSTPPPQSQSSSAQTTPSPKGNAPPMPYPPQHPSPHSNPPPLQQQQQQQHVPPRESPRDPLMHTMHPQEVPPNMHPTPPPQHQQQQHPNREQQQQQQQTREQQQHPVREPTPQHQQQQMMHNIHMGHMQQQQQQQQHQQQHQPAPQQQMTHARHAHTPPSHVVYNQNNMQRQGPPPNHNNNAPKQMNGDVKMQPQRPPRNVYPSPNMVQPQQYQQQQELPPKPQEQQQQQQQHMNNVVPRHARDETNKEFAKFAQDFKLAPSPADGMQQQQQQQQQVPPEQQQMVQKQHPMPQATPPQQPQQSISPQQQDGIDKVSSLTLKKSNLNPNAKEFVLNPTAKPFTPRSPSTPTASRPHTPQTPSNPYNIPTTINGPPGQPPMPVMVPMGYMMASQPQYQQQVQANRLRKAPMGQMRTDVTNVTGQPLLAPAPMQPFVYPPGMNPQQYQPMHTVRMYESAPQIQYLTNPSNNPSPSQPPPYSQQQHQQQQQQQQYQQAPPPQGHPQFNIMCPILPAQAHMMQQGMHYLQQPPPPQGMQTLLAPHHLVQQHGQQP